MTSTDTKKMSLVQLTAMVVGSMVGAGIFSLPRTFGNATGPFGAIIAWLVAGTGMYMLARVFQSLAERKPDLDAGVYAYAKAGFGDYPGFLSAFGYWIGSCIGNVSYWVLIKSTLGAFFPVFGTGNTVVAILVASVGIWLFHFMILRGIQQAAVVNTIVTFAKIIPIIVFILVLIAYFRYELFQANFWGGAASATLFDQDYRGYAHQHLTELPQASLFEQVRATMLTTVFVFIGIEGASVYSRYASERSHVGKATIIGFVGVTGLMVLVTLLPYAVLHRAEIANMRQPSMASVLEAVVGPWGAVFVSLGLIVSVLGAYLAWSLICAEVLFAAAKTKDMPALFAKESARKVPANALWLTNIIVQILVVSTYFSYDAFMLMLNLTSAMSLIPYLLVAAYGLMTARRGETYDARPEERRRDLIMAGVASTYTVFLIFAGGLKFVLLSAVLYAPGTALYIWTRREQGKVVFKPLDWAIFGIAVVGAVAGVYGLIAGAITL
ncbi:MAG TPA: basic amino acid/polyamine antiporter [Rhizomicrobium sp.]|nr:basic amino acid/polyamine antiporter [Rhizomicrobium sp.]